MNETELENLVVRLTGDGTSYEKMLTEAAEHTHHAAEEVHHATESIEHMEGGLREWAATALEGLEALGTAEFLKSAFEEFSELEKVEEQPMTVKA